METASSLVAKSPGSPVKAMLTATILWSGLSRPGMTPVCGPSEFRGSAREKVLPVRTQAAPRRTASASMRLRVPRSSSSPQRPQLEMRWASATKSSERLNAEGDFAHASRSVHRVLVETGDDLASEQLDRLHRGLVGHRRRQRTDDELVAADVGVGLAHPGVVLGIADAQYAGVGAGTDLVGARRRDHFRPRRKAGGLGNVVEPVEDE